MKALDVLKKDLCIKMTEGGRSADEGFAGYFRNSKNLAFRIVASWGGGWDHVSVSTPTRCPTWEEMCEVKDAFFHPLEVVMQLHPSKEEYVNCHKYCLHLWKPQKETIPTPPADYVGPRR